MDRNTFIKTITRCGWEPNSSASEYYAYTKKYNEFKHCDIICNADSVIISTQAGIYSRLFSGIFEYYDDALSMLLIIQCELG